MFSWAGLLIFDIIEFVADVILEVKNLKKSYDGKVAVDGISFVVEKGEIFGILGPNGAGKTTTLEMIETLREIDGGSATIDGIDVATRPYEIRSIIGVQPQTPGFQDKTKLTELIQLFAAAYGEKVNPKKFLDEVNLGEKADSYVENLSGGQKQRFSIVAALVHNPKVFFLDEPTTGLDPQARRNLWKLIEEVRDRGISVILTTHYMDEAEVLCDRIAIMDNGKIIALDTPQNLIKTLLKRGFKKKAARRTSQPRGCLYRDDWKGATPLMHGLWIAIIIVVIVALRFFTRQAKKSGSSKRQVRPLSSPWQRKLYTVWTFFVVSLRRVFRDRVALFFTFLFPLIFLFVFGGIFGHGSGSSFNVAIINDSSSQYAQQFVANAESSNQKLLKVDKSITTLSEANEKMGRGALNATIELPASFGKLVNGMPSGRAIVHYTENNQQAAQTLTSVLQAEFQGTNATLVKTVTPFTVTSTQTNERSLTAFDYTFTGLIGFAILGAGIFGPMNVFPELKKMGILRRLHTTPLRVWQYFMSTMMGYAVTGLMSIGLMFIVAIAIFHLKVVGSYIDLTIFLAFSIIMVLGIGLALGGWAKNERQVAPLGNIIVFPMMFLTGVFFPRFLMPEWLQSITTYMPLTPVIDGARLIATEGKSLAEVGSQLAIMAVWTVIIYIIAFRVFRWE